jgi:2-aminoadipate transaminase
MPDMISLSGGMPEVSRVPIAAVAQAASEAIMHEGAAALQYGSSEGREQIRTIIAELMAEIGVRLSPGEVVVTAGAQQALDLIAKAFIDPGDVIITEGPTYVGALQAFSAYQPDIRCIPMDDDGMRTDLLEEELKRLGPRGAKFIYTIPNFQNPAGVTMSPERRRRLLELAREYDIPVVEDDPYGRLRFEGGHMKPLRSLDDEVIYLGTFSKIFAPGLRLGWVTAPRPILAKILLVKQGADLCGSNFAQVTAERYFLGTRWRRVLQGLTATYSERRDAMLAALDEHFPPEARWTRPDGGFFVWVEMPPYVDCASMLAEAVEHGVTFVPGDGFYPDGRGRNCMRLAFCYAEPEKIAEGIRRLAEVLEDRLELYRAFIAAGAIEVEEGAA